MSVIPTPGELLEDLLEGGCPSLDELTAFANSNSTEGLHHDFKSGKLVKQDRKAGIKIRRAVASFANSSGGFLVLGCGEGQPRPLEPCQTLRPSAREWVTNVLQPIAGSIYPPPRIEEIPVNGGFVVVVATPRGPSLIPVLETGELRYYIRFHDTTVRAPDYLVADLMLGRRTRPALELECVEATASAPIAPDGLKRLTLYLRFLVRNAGLADARNVRLLLFQPTPRGDTLPHEILTHLETHSPVRRIDCLLQNRAHDVVPLLTRFTGSVFEARFVQDLPSNDVNEYRECSAICLSASDSPPIWYELRRSIDAVSPPKGDVLTSVHRRKMTPDRRPLVYWGKREDFTKLTDERWPWAR